MILILHAEKVKVDKYQVLMAKHKIENTGLKFI